MPWAGWLLVVKTHCWPSSFGLRPHVSNDNPFSEAQYKTLKYSPTYTGQFGTLEGSREWCAPFFDHYNNQHRHSSLDWMTPADVHFGRIEQVNAERSRALQLAYHAHPERFVRKQPTPPSVPDKV
ncbi:MAG: putative transposase [Planctomycetota bacterium]|jgi:putative transposase